jgi:hypothetical protein
VDAVLEACEAGMCSLQSRGKSHLPGFTKMKERHTRLARKRRELGQDVAAAANAE